MLQLEVQSPPIACHFHIDKQKQTSKQAKGYGHASASCEISVCFKMHLAEKRLYSYQDKRRDYIESQILRRMLKIF